MKIGMLFGCAAIMLAPALAMGTEAAPDTARTLFPATPSFVVTGFSTLLMGIEAGDLNNDGKPDLAVSSWYRNLGPKAQYDANKSRVFVFYQTNGTYAFPPNRELAVKEPRALKIGDFDNDGQADLAVLPSGVLHLFLGMENFAVDRENFTPNGGAGPINTGKLSKDGICDFITGPVWRKWLGANRFKPGYFYFAGPPANDNGAAILTDLNLDG